MRRRAPQGEQFVVANWRLLTDCSLPNDRIMAGLPPSYCLKIVVDKSSGSLKMRSNSVE
jgi:hypothetical protein